MVGDRTTPGPALSIGAAGGYGYYTISEFELHVPVHVGYRFSEMHALYVVPRLVRAWIPTGSRDEPYKDTDIGGALGFALGMDRILYVEGTYSQELGSPDMRTYGAGVGVGFN